MKIQNNSIPSQNKISALGIYYLILSSNHLQSPN